MDEPTFDRRSLLQTTGALVGASALGIIGSGAAAAETEASTVETTAGKTTPQFGQSDPQEIYIDLEMTFENHEGEEVTETPTLYGEVIRPVDDDGTFVEDVPVVLTYTPYGDLYKPLNGGDSTATDGIADYFVPRGYARVVVDLIGCRNSGGYYDYGGIRERLSGKQLVESLSEEVGWTNGNVGMIGGSYDGTTQFATAIENPDGLKAIVPQVAIDRWYDYRHFGGVPRSTVGTPTLFDFGFAAVPPRAKDRPAHNVDVATTRVQPSRRAEFERRSYEYNANYDDFWVEREYRQHAGNVPDDCAVMVEGGWEDRNVIRWGSTRFYEALKEAGHEKRRLVMGDWPHAAGQYPDSTDLYHALYDQFLLTGDEDWHDVGDTYTGIMDLPEVDVQSASAPRTQFGTWPPEGAQKQRLPFVRNRDDVDGLALGLVGTSLNTWQDASPPPAESDFFEERNSGDKYLMFETAELDDDLRFTGHVTADLLAASSADTWYTAVVYERREEGSVRPFSRGAWNSRFRNGEQTESDTPTDEAYRVGVETWDINWRVSAGSRLGVVIASDNDDYVRHDPRNESTNQLILGESSLHFDGFAKGLNTVEFPNATLSREIDRANSAGGEEVSAHFAGWTARCTVTVDAASDDISVRVPIPDGWEIVGGDDYAIETVSGTTYVVFTEPANEGDERTVLLSAPDETGEYPFGPVEYSAAAELWAAADDTAETAVVVGVETTV